MVDTIIIRHLDPTLFLASSNNPTRRKSLVKIMTWDINTSATLCYGCYIFGNVINYNTIFHTSNPTHMSFSVGVFLLSVRFKLGNIFFSRCFYIKFPRTLRVIFLVVVAVNGCILCNMKIFFQFVCTRQTMETTRRRQWLRG